MNENMSRLKDLKDLIGEVSKTIQNLEAETEEIRQKNIAEREKQLRHMLDTIQRCQEVTKELRYRYTPKVRLKSHGHYYDSRLKDHCYYFTLSNDNYISVYEGKDYFVGSILFRDAPYESIKRGCCGRCCYDIDAILDAWDDADFEAEFAKEVERILTVITKKANANYEAAKRGEI